MPHQKLIEWLESASFCQVSDKPGLYRKECSEIIGNDGLNLLAFVDFRKEAKGIRFYKKDGSLNYDTPDDIEVLKEYKKARDALLGNKLIERPNKDTEVQSYKKQSDSSNMFQSGKSYKVSGKAVPDAAMTQRESNKHQISIQIITAEQMGNYAKAIVRASLPNGQYVDDVVLHDFNMMKDVILMDLIKESGRANKNIIEKYDDGKPILNPEYQKRLYERFIRQRYFSLRDAVTKATRRAQLKLLNYEWRENDEVDSEKLEERMVE